jgi:hypothetical protein
MLWVSEIKLIIRLFTAKFESFGSTNTWTACAVFWIGGIGRLRTFGSVPDAIEAKRRAIRPITAAKANGVLSLKPPSHKNDSLMTILLH